MDELKQDGYITIVSTLPLGDDSTFRYNFEDMSDKGWEILAEDACNHKPAGIYIHLTRPEKGRVYWPWPSVYMYNITYNSDEYIKRQDIKHALECISDLEKQYAEACVKLSKLRGEDTPVTQWSRLRGQMEGPRDPFLRTIAEKIKELDDPSSNAKTYVDYKLHCGAHEGPCEHG